MKLRRVLFSLVVLVLMLALFACNGKNYKITFDSNGGSAVAEISAKAGAAITKPADPTKEGLTFGGWYDIDLVEKYEFPATMPEENVELYAKWVVTLTFDTQGGPQVNAVVGEGGKTFRMPADPVRDGYVFVGWFTDKTYTTQLTYVMPKTNTTAYAKWQVLEEGSAVTVGLDFFDNDNVFSLETTADGVKMTASSGKQTYSYIAATIPCGVKQNTTAVVELVGTKGASILLKVEGGNAEQATEQTFEMTGEVQKCIWTDSDNKFSSVAGARFLIFLCPNVPGEETNGEYAIIKSIKLYRTVDADATPKAAIHFATNGGDEIEAIYEVPGTAVTKPEDPEKVGYIFDGWYSDSALTTEFVFDKMPAGGAMAYAKWNKAKKMQPDIPILGAATNKTDGAYTTSFENGTLKFKKNATGNEWDCIFVDWPEATPDMKGYDHLLVSIYGTKGEKVLLKINDVVEKWITLTGGYETLDLAFEHTFNMNEKPLYLFAKPGETGASGEVFIGYLAFSNHQTIFDLMDATLEVGEDVPTTIEKKDDGTISIKKDPKEGTEWDCALFKLDADMTNVNKVQIIFQGTAGEEVMFKIFDAQEEKVTLTGQQQVLYVDVTATYNPKKAALVVFANPNALGTGHEVIIYSAMLVALYKEPELVGDVDLLAGEIEPQQTTEKVDVVLSISKPADVEDPDWKCAVAELTDPDYEGINKLVVKVKGTAGEVIKFKVNDTREFDVTCTGEEQEEEFTFELTFDEAKFALVVFCNPGGAGTGHPFEISKAELVGEGKSINLLTAAWRSLDAGVYQIEKKVVISKSTEGNEWDCIAVKITGDFGSYAGVKYSVKGTAGQKLLFKINNQNTGETWLDLTGEVQSGILTKIPADYNASEYVMYLFPDGGLKGTGNAIEIYELTFLSELPAE